MSVAERNVIVPPNFFELSLDRLTTSPFAPNPATLKFLPGKTVMDEGTIFFQSEETADKSPLAVNLFAVRGVESVFFGSDFITITKADSSEWSLM